jgi:hypothetical protein
MLDYGPHDDINGVSVMVWKADAWMTHLEEVDYYLGHIWWESPCFETSVVHLASGTAEIIQAYEPDGLPPACARTNAMSRVAALR